MHWLYARVSPSPLHTNSKCERTMKRTAFTPRAYAENAYILWYARTIPPSRCVRTHLVDACGGWIGNPGFLLLSLSLSLSLSLFSHYWENTAAEFSPSDVGLSFSHRYRIRCMILSFSTVERLGWRANICIGCGRLRSCKEKWKRKPTKMFINISPRAGRPRFCGKFTRFSARRFIEDISLQINYYVIQLGYSTEPVFEILQYSVLCVFDILLRHFKRQWNANPMLVHVSSLKNFTESQFIKSSSLFKRCSWTAAQMHNQPR